MNVHSCPHHAHNKNGELFRLFIAAFLTLSFGFIELIYGKKSHSWSLQSDALHMWMDSFGLFFSVGIQMTAQYVIRKHQNIRSFKKIEAIGGIVGALLTLYFVYRLMGQVIFTGSTEAMQGALALSVSILGLLINLFCLYLVHPLQDHGVNLKGAYLHILGDLMGSFLAIVSAVCALTLTIKWVDQICAVLMGGWLFISAFLLLRQSLNQYKLDLH